MSGRALLGGMVAACAALVAFLFVQLHQEPRAEATCTDPAPVCLPDRTFLDTAGHVLPPSSLAGKVVVVNFWATWCLPCRREIPDLSAVAEAYHDRGVVVLGVVTDQPSDAELAAFIRDTGVGYPVVRSDSEMMRQFEYPEALPTTFIYDRSGRSVVVRPGAITRRELEALLDPLLGP